MKEMCLIMEVDGGFDHYFTLVPNEHADDYEDEERWGVAYKTEFKEFNTALDAFTYAADNGMKIVGEIHHIMS